MRNMAPVEPKSSGTPGMKLNSKGKYLMMIISTMATGKSSSGTVSESQRHSNKQDMSRDPRAVPKSHTERDRPMVISFP